MKKLLGGLTLSAGLSLSAAGFAAQIVKNGGAIVSGTCYQTADHQPVSGTEILDFYEWRLNRHWTPDLGAPDLAVADKIEHMLRRLERLDPARVTLLRGWLATFDQERAWLDNGGSLPSVDDIGGIREILPSGCTVLQAAGQRIPLNPPFDPYYIIDQALWNRLNNDSRAGLILHELIYRDGVNRGHDDSIGTRFLVAMLASDLIDRGAISTEEYQRSLFRYRFDSYSVGYFRLYPDHPVSASDARAFCEGLASNAELAKAEGGYIRNSSGHDVNLAYFKSSAVGRYILALPSDMRLIFLVSYDVLKIYRLYSSGLVLNADQNVTALPLCSVEL